MTTLSRLPVNARELASALRPADTDAVTAISSGSARSRFATRARTDSFFIAHVSQLDPIRRRSST